MFLRDLIAKASRQHHDELVLRKGYNPRKAEGNKLLAKLKRQKTTFRPRKVRRLTAAIVTHEYENDLKLMIAIDRMLDQEPDIAA